jgi:phospholipid transport system substrate-binding protein
MMNRFLCLVMVCILQPWSFSGAHSADLRLIDAPVFYTHISTTPLEQGARDFVDSVAARGIGFLSKDKSNIAEQKRLFRALLQDSFDLPTIGRFALGKYWRAATSSQRSEYQKLFEKMVIDTYSSRFSAYKGQVLTVLSGRSIEGGDVMVKSQIVPTDGSEKINIDWRVRGKPGSFKIVDIVIEGVSMAVTQRSDFSGLIGQKNGDIQTLIDHLKNREKDVGVR